MLSKLIEKIKKLINTMNEKGVPIPLAKINGKPTLTGTLTVLSGTSVLLGTFGKFSGLVGGVDLTQGIYFFGVCLAGYLGRKFQGDPATKSITVESGEKE